MATESTLPDPEYEKFNSKSTALEDIDLSDKTILITGTTSGIGIETARALAIRGAHIVMANRSITRSEALRDQIYKETEHRKIDLIHMDLSSLQSVQAAAKEFLGKNWPLHVLILNAGVMAAQPPVTIDNLNNNFQTNHLGHFYLTNLLKDKLIESVPSRIVVVSSTSHKHTMIKANAPLEDKIEKLLLPVNSTAPAYLQYARTKLANVLFALKLHRDLNANGVSVFVLHPGDMMATEIGRSYGMFNKIFMALVKPFTKNLEQGAATTVYCAALPNLTSGHYFENCFDDQKNLQANLACDETLQDAFWTKCSELIEKFENSH